MTVKDDFEANPLRFDLFRILREYERSYNDKPRIGDSTVMAEDVVAIVQDPFVTFADTNITGVDTNAIGTPRIHTRFLGYFGPQGALPLNTTMEAYNWLPKDPSFTRFTDIFTIRFLQLFYRAWADAQPIAHHDRPADDNFGAYIASFSGFGSGATEDRDDVADIAKMPYSGLAGSRIKSARRLAQLLRGVLGLDATVVERVGTWLLFEPSDIMAVGQNGSSLGTDTFLGVRSYSIGDKFRINIRTTDLEQYMWLLPGSPGADKLADLVFFYIGYRYEFDVELSLLARLAPPTRLGASGQLGWTSWVAPPPEPEDSERYVSDARFDLMERRRVTYTARQGTKQQAGTARNE